MSLAGAQGAVRPRRGKAAMGVLALALGAACQPENHVPPDSPTVGMIIILDYAHQPRRITASAGGAVLVRNQDPVQHTVTSSAVAGSHLFGAVNGVAFDTGPFLGDRVIDIAADAPVGTVVPYFCQLHAGAEVDEGEIEIVAPP